jgi:hypothetical protein
MVRNNSISAGFFAGMETPFAQPRFQQHTLRAAGRRINESMAG